MSIFTPNTVAHSWELLNQLTEELPSFYQKPWRTQACLVLYKTHQKARSLGFPYYRPQIDVELSKDQRDSITQPNSPNTERLHRLSKHKDVKLNATILTFEQALQRQDINEAIACIFYIQNSHARQRAWLRLGWYWLEQQNLIGAEQMLEKLLLPQLQEEKLLLQAEIFFQKNLLNRAIPYLESLEPNLRRYSFMRHGLRLDFIMRCLSLKARLWSKNQGSGRLTAQQADLLCNHLQILHRVYQHLTPRTIESFLKEQPATIIKRLREALRFAKLAAQCDAIMQCLEQAPSLPKEAKTPEEAYWLGALCQNRYAPTGELRAYFDAGKATHPEHNATAALLRASKREIENTGKQNHTSNAVLARLQCLDSLPQVSIVDWLRALFIQHPNTLDPEVLGAILKRSPKQAKGLFLEEFLRITAQGNTTQSWMEKLQHAKVFGGPFSAALLVLQRCAQSSLGEGYGVSWVSYLLRAWWRRFGQAPSAEALQAITQGFQEISEQQRQWMLSLEPEQAIQQLLQQGESAAQDLLSLTPNELLTHLNQQPALLPLLQCFSPAPTLFHWEDKCWRDTLSRLQKQTYDIDLSMIKKFTHNLSTPHHPALIEKLLLGQCPVEDLATSVLLEEPYTLRYLDKRKDLFAFLRLADPVTCCFSSTPDKGVYQNQRWIFDLWRDPLSFCFWIEERSEASGTLPFGFVFGSFATQEGRPAVMFNGLYLKRQKPSLREKIVAHLEESFCRPLHIKKIAISNSHAGYGYLPSSYHATRTKVTRLRALRGADGLQVTSIYDDISWRVNQEFTTHYPIYWRQLA
jgi:hypothetical protein